MIQFPYILYPLAIISAILIGFIITRWVYYREFKIDKTKRCNNVINISDSSKEAILKMGRTMNRKIKDANKSKVINLPPVYSPKEMQFIDEWYMEEGILQLKQANGKEFVLLKDKPPVPGCKYVNVDRVMVNFKKRDNRTLELIDIQIPKTVKLLMLDAWIK